MKNYPNLHKIKEKKNLCTQKFYIILFYYIPFQGLPKTRCIIFILSNS